MWRTLAAALCSMLAAILARPAAAQQACPTLTVVTQADTVNGDTSSPCALIGDPGPDGISLREALLAANNATGAGFITIVFAPSLTGATIALTTRFAPVTRGQIALVGLTSNGQPVITIDATSASNPGAVLFIAASQFAMSGVNVTNLPDGFSAMQIGGSGYDLQGHPVSSPQQQSGISISGNAFSSGNGSNTFAIDVVSNISNGTISNLTIAHNSFADLFEAINVQGGGNAASGSVIQDVSIHDNSFLEMTSYAGVELGDTNGTNNIISRMAIWQNTFTNGVQSVEMDVNSNGQPDSGSVVEDILIAGNVFVGDQSDVQMDSGVGNQATGNAIRNIQIVNNLIDSTGSDLGIAMEANEQGGSGNTISGVLIANNTIAGPGGSSVGIGPGGGVSDVSIVNTILNGSNGLANVAPSQISYSITCASGYAGVNHNACSDPKFVNPAAGDFHLQPDSPALHAGTALSPNCRAALPSTAAAACPRVAPADDLDCQSRGFRPSIGAYEFDGPDICNSPRLRSGPRSLAR